MTADEVILALAFAVMIVASGALAGIIFTETRNRWHARSIRRKVEEWRKRRHRAPIFRAGTVEGGVARYWVFVSDGSIPREIDPLTNEVVVYGWSRAELVEIASRPSEFELT